MTSNTNNNTKNDTQAQGNTTPGQKQEGNKDSNVGQNLDDASKVEPMKKDGQGNDMKQDENAAESTPAKTGSDKR